MTLDMMATVFQSANRPVIESLIAPLLSERVYPEGENLRMPQSLQKWTEDQISSHFSYYNLLRSDFQYGPRPKRVTDNDRKQCQLMTMRLHLLETVRAFLTILRSDYGRKIDETGEIELHGLSLAHAPAYVRFHVNRFYQLCQRTDGKERPRQLSFLAGRGNGSLAHTSPLRQKVFELLKNMGCSPVVEQNAFVVVQMDNILASEQVKNLNMKELC